MDCENDDVVVDDGVNNDDGGNDDDEEEEEEEEQEAFDVETFLDRLWNKDTQSFDVLVKFRGYDEPEWHPESDVDAGDLWDALLLKKGEKKLFPNPKLLHPRTKQLQT